MLNARRGLPLFSPWRCIIVIKTIIAAISSNGVIGSENDIPWHYPADMKHFRDTTRGYPVIAGRKTYESFQVRPLPGRLNIVLSRNADYSAERGAEVSPRGGAPLVGRLAFGRVGGSLRSHVVG